VEPETLTVKPELDYSSYANCPILVVAFGARMIVHEPIFVNLAFERRSDYEENYQPIW
jgi:hypothetical protein